MEPKLPRLIELCNLVMELGVTDDEVRSTISVLRNRQPEILPEPTGQTTVGEVFTLLNIYRYTKVKGLAARVFNSVGKSKRLPPNRKIVNITVQDLQHFSREKSVGAQILDVVQKMLVSEGHNLGPIFE